MVSKRIKQTERIENIRLPLTEMITVIMPFQHKPNFIFRHIHFLRHRIHLIMKHRFKLILRNTTYGIIHRTHADICRLIETAEHTYLRKLCHPS